MIIDSIENVKHYRNLNERIRKGLEFLEEVDFETIEPGRYNIEGDEIFAMVQEYDTKHPADAKVEAHERYLDIQYMVNGEETMGYALLEDQELSIAYNAEKDVVFYKATTNNFILKEGMFAIFYPNDLHAPGMMTETPKKVKKVVVKILL